MRPWSVTNIQLPSNIPSLPPPPFLQTYSEIGEDRDEFSPIKENNPANGSISQFVFSCLFLIIYLITLYKVYTLCAFVHISFLGLLVDLLSSHRWPQVEQL